MNYETISAAEFTEHHLVTLEQFRLWDAAGRPTLCGFPVICATSEEYARIIEGRDE